MSHTTKLNNVAVRDVSALEAAVANLKAKGINVELVRDAYPRMYSSAQAKALGKCDFVVKLNDSPYDVGFVKQKDGSYSPAMDTYMGHVERNIGATCPLQGGSEADRAEHAIGQLMQQYAVEAAKNSAEAQGYTVSDTTVDAEGNVHLTVDV